MQGEGKGARTGWNDGRSCRYLMERCSHHTIRPNVDNQPLTKQKAARVSKKPKNMAKICPTKRMPHLAIIDDWVEQNPGICSGENRKKLKHILEPHLPSNHLEKLQIDMKKIDKWLSEALKASRKETSCPEKTNKAFTPKKVGDPNIYYKENQRAKNQLPHILSSKQSNKERYPF
jgi:hypothetical protein